MMKPLPSRSSPTARSWWWGTSDFSFGLARYNPDGTLDPSFGIGGKVTTAFAADSFDQAATVAIQSDGKIVVAGSSDFQ